MVALLMIKNETAKTNSYHEITEYCYESDSNKEMLSIYFLWLSSLFCQCNVQHH